MQGYDKYQTYSIQHMTLKESKCMQYLHFTL